MRNCLISSANANINHNKYYFEKRKTRTLLYLRIIGMLTRFKNHFSTFLTRRSVEVANLSHYFDRFCNLPRLEQKRDNGIRHGVELRNPHLKINQCAD